jgi:hypothetical protein
MHYDARIGGRVTDNELKTTLQQQQQQQDEPKEKGDEK